MGKVKIKLDHKVTNLRGEPIKLDEKTGKLLDVRETISGQLLGEHGATEPLKNWRMAKEIYDCKDKVIELSESDIEYIEGVIKKSQDSVTVKGQMLQILADAKLKAQTDKSI